MTVVLICYHQSVAIHTYTHITLLQLDIFFTWQCGLDIFPCQDIQVCLILSNCASQPTLVILPSSIHYPPSFLCAGGWPLRTASTGLPCPLAFSWDQLVKGTHKERRANGEKRQSVYYHPSVLCCGSSSCCAFLWPLPAGCPLISDSSCWVQGPRFSLLALSPQRWEWLPAVNSP